MKDIVIPIFGKQSLFCNGFNQKENEKGILNRFYGCW